MTEDFTQRATCKRYYKFENASDLGEDNQGTVALINNNGVTQSSTIPSGTYAGPSATKSADFEVDSDQYLSATHNDSLDLDDLTAFTMLGWFYLESHGSGICVVADKSNWGNDGFQCFFYPSQTPDKFDFRFAGTEYKLDMTMSTSTWYFVACTYNQTDDLQKVYYGAEETEVSLLGSNSLTDATAATAQGFAIGSRWSSGPDWEFDGLMCELSFFSEELSLAEFQEIQVDGMEGTPAAGNPYYYFMSQFKLDWDKMFPRPKLGKLWKPNPRLATAKLR